MPFRAKSPPAPTAAQPARRGALVNPAEGGEQGGVGWGGGGHMRDRVVVSWRAASTAPLKRVTRSHSWRACAVRVCAGARVRGIEGRGVGGERQAARRHHVEREGQDGTAWGRGVLDRAGRSTTARCVARRG